MKEVGRERARKKEKTLTEHAAARQGLLRRARPAGRSAIRLLFLSSLPSPLSPRAPPLSPSTAPCAYLFSRRGGVTLSSDTRSYTGCRAPLVPLSSPRPPAPFSLARLVRLCPSQPWHGWVPKKRRKKPLETSRLAQKTTTTATVATAAAAAATIAAVLPPAHHCPAKTILHLRTCANCESKPPRTCSPRSARVLLAVTRINRMKAS